MFGKKKKIESLKDQVARTQRAVYKLDSVNDQLFVSLINMTNQQKGVTVKK